MDQNKSNGALIGSFVIIIILIIGGVYLMKNKVDERKTAEEVPTTEDSVSKSDDLSDIEADLNANGDFDSLDSGLE